LAKTTPKDLEMSVCRILDINLNDIPRPPGFSDKSVDDLVNFLFRDRDKLAERLGKMIDEAKNWDYAETLSFAARANAGHFRILKGNIAEILSMDIQRKVLEEVVNVKKNPGAKLYTGIQMRLMDGSGKLSDSVLFSDNIIAVVKGDELQVKAVFEVKSGFQGGLEAQEQIFKWNERILEDGSEIIIPRGTKIFHAGEGPLQSVQTRMKFTYKPPLVTKKVRGVVNLTRADRHLITGFGVSHLGIGSSQQVAGKVIRHPLAFTSSELDYLVARVFPLLRQ
jgi:hypothetical protein